MQKFGKLEIILEIFSISGFPGYNVCAVRRLEISRFGDNLEID